MLLISGQFWSTVHLYGHPKGAEVRRQKLEALKAKLAAAKETVFHENNEEHSEPKTTISRSTADEGPGWGVGIVLAVGLGVALFAFSKKLQVPSSERAKPLVPAPVQ